MADFFKRWLEYAREIDKDKEYPEEPYVIGSIDRATALNPLPSLEDESTHQNPAASNTA